MLIPECTLWTYFEQAMKTLWVKSPCFCGLLLYLAAQQGSFVKGSTDGKQQLSEGVGSQAVILNSCCRAAVGGEMLTESHFNPYSLIFTSSL